MSEYQSFFKTVGGGEGSRCSYPTRLDMYGKGCQHNCQYCYARSLLEFRGLWNYQEPSLADKTKVLKVLDKLPQDIILRLGGMTDPFQPIETQYKLNEWLIGELNNRNMDYLIVTKSKTVAECETLDPNHAHIQVTITSTGDKAPIGFEEASTPDERFQAVENLVDRGFDVQIRLSPFIPQLYDLDQVLESPCEKVVVEFLRVNTFIKRNLPSMNFEQWTEKSGGYSHLPLNVKMNAIAPLLAKKRVTVCEDHPEHYDYFHDHVNPNKDDCCDLKVKE